MTSFSLEAKEPGQKCVLEGTCLAKTYVFMKDPPKEREKEKKKEGKNDRRRNRLLALLFVALRPPPLRGTRRTNSRRRTLPYRHQRFTYTSGQEGPLRAGPPAQDAEEKGRRPAEKGGTSWKS